jgi:hypothetical protein
MRRRKHADDRLENSGENNEDEADKKDATVKKK